MNKSTAETLLGSRSSSSLTGKFRKRVFKLCTEFPERHPTFSAGLRVALGEYRDTWQEASVKSFSSVPAPPSATSDVKRERDESRPTLKLSHAPGTGKKAGQEREDKGAREPSQVLESSSVFLQR